MLTGTANFNTEDTTVGYAAEIQSKRDAILSRVTLSPYAVARITGLPVRWPAEPTQRKSPKVAPVRWPAAQTYPEAQYSLPQIAAMCAVIWDVTVQDMQRPSREGPAMRATLMTSALCRMFTRAKNREIATFFGRKSDKSGSEWALQSGRLYEGNPYYRERYDAAKRALESPR